MGVYQWDGEKPYKKHTDRRQIEADQLLMEYRTAVKRGKTAKWVKRAAAAKRRYEQFISNQVNFSHRYQSNGTNDYLL